MFEEQSQKIYDTLVGKINNLFAKKPFISSLVISVIVSLTVFLVSMDYKRGEARVEITSSNAPIEVQGNNTKIRVDLSGAVKAPGVYTLTLESRLSDLVTLGGGFVSDVSAQWVSKNLNLSQSMQDGDKVYIPFEWDIAVLGGDAEVKVLSLGVSNGSKQKSLVSGALKTMGVGVAGGGESSSSHLPAGNSSDSSKVNVNTADASGLDGLPGVGPSYAGRIIENRPYVSFDDFKEKSGLSGTLVESLKDLISF